MQSTDVEAALRRVLDTYRDAVYQRDTDALLALYGDEVLIFDTWGEWSYNGIASWRGMVTAWFGSLSNERVIVGFEDLCSTIDRDLALVHAYVTYKAVAAEGAEVRSMHERLTWVLRQNDGEWRIIHQHASAPVEHKTLKGHPKSLAPPLSFSTDGRASCGLQIRWIFLEVCYMRILAQAQPDRAGRQYCMNSPGNGSLCEP